MIFAIDLTAMSMGSDSMIIRLGILKMRSLCFRFHRLQKEFECDGRYAPDGSRKGRQMTKPNTLRAESWFNGWLLFDLN